jgi:(1->4)-alpha-D-glucan 1-alpha-D-glucosylmutase
VPREDEEVFRVTHEKVLELVRDGVDRRACASTIPTASADPPATAPPGGRRRGARLGREDPPHRRALRDWPVEGTVGYEFLNDADRRCSSIRPARPSCTDLFAS